MEFMYLVFTRMPGESYRRRLRSGLFYLCYVFRTLNYLLCVYIVSNNTKATTESRLVLRVAGFK